MGFMLFLDSDGCLAVFSSFNSFFKMTCSILEDKMSLSDSVCVETFIFSGDDGNDVNGVFILASTKFKGGSLWGTGITVEAAEDVVSLSKSVLLLKSVGSLKLVVLSKLSKSVTICSFTDKSSTSLIHSVWFCVCCFLGFGGSGSRWFGSFLFLLHFSTSAFESVARIGSGS